MTLRSRRKRQITARNTRTASLLNKVSARSVAVMGLALATLLATLTSSAMADTTQRDRLIRQSTGQNGAKLKWLPYRPAARSVAAAQEQSRQEAHQVEFTSYRTSDPAEPQPNQLVDNNQWQLPVPGETPTPPAPLDIAAPQDTAPQDLGAPSMGNQEVPGPPRDLPESIRDAIDKEGPSSRYEGYQIPSAPQERAEGLFKQYNDCPSEHDFKPIDELTDKVVISDGDYPKECTLPGKDFEPRDWDRTLFTWKASGLCHNPLYFEELQLERYGHSWGPYIQPIISQGHFFVTVPFLPYKMGVSPPRECEYSLGYYRPGNCAPYMIDPLPISVRGGLIQAATITGAAYLLP